MNVQLRRRHWLMWLLLAPVLLLLVIAGIGVRSVPPVQNDTAPRASTESPS